MPYIGLIILMYIPIVNLIAAILFAHSKGNINRRNFARANLVFIIPSLVIGVGAAVLGWIMWSAINEFLTQAGIAISWGF